MAGWRLGDRLAPACLPMPLSLPSEMACGSVGGLENSARRPPSLCRGQACHPPAAASSPTLSGANYSLCSVPRWREHCSSALMFQLKHYLCLEGEGRDARDRPAPHLLPASSQQRPLENTFAFCFMKQAKTPPLSGFNLVRPPWVCVSVVGQEVVVDRHGIAVRRRLETHPSWPCSPHLTPCACLKTRRPLQEGGEQEEKEQKGQTHLTSLSPSRSHMPPAP